MRIMANNTRIAGDPRIVAVDTRIVVPILGLMVSALPILKPMKTVLSSKSTRALLSVKEGLTAVPPLMEIFLCKNALRITPALSLLEIIATGLIFGIYHGLHLVCVLGLLGVPKMWSEHVLVRTRAHSSSHRNTTVVVVVVRVLLPALLCHE